MHQGFWSESSTIKWFADQPSPEYWVSFFSEYTPESLNPVLDLGCGAGRNTEMLFGLGYKVAACDLSDDMLRSTQSGLKKSIGQTGDILTRCNMSYLPYPNCAFGAVLSNGVFHNAENISDMLRAYAETARVIKPGGYLCFNTFVSTCLDLNLEEISESVYRTKEGLLMVLISAGAFLNSFELLGLEPAGKIHQYNRELPTGIRAVLRGVMQKIR